MLQDCCTSRSTGRRGAEMVCAAFRSRAAPLLSCTPHLGAHRIPLPRFRTPAPLVRSTLRLGCASPCSHTLCAFAVCFPGCTTHRSVPLPSRVDPLRAVPPWRVAPSRAVPLRAVPPWRVAPSRAAPLRVGPLTRDPLCVALPLHAPPSLLCFRYARKRGGGRAGVVGHRGRAQPG